MASHFVESDFAASREAFRRLQIGISHFCHTELVLVAEKIHTGL